jgi:hypothetical protein
MSDEGRPNPRLNEDLHFERGDGPPDYGSTTDKPIRYFAVADDASTLLGYVWASHADDAAAWEPRPSAGPKAFNASFLWEMLQPPNRRPDVRAHSGAPVEGNRSGSLLRYAGRVAYVAKAKLAVQLQLIEILLVRDDPVVLDVKHAATADGDLTSRPF